jgi:hypothetical protein
LIHKSRSWQRVCLPVFKALEHAVSSEPQIIPTGEATAMLPVRRAKRQAHHRDRHGRDPRETFDEV